MKKKLTILLIVLAVCCVFFTACKTDGKPPQQPFESSVTIVIQGEKVIVSYEADLSGGNFNSSSTVLDVLIYLKDTAGLTYSGGGSGSTFFLNSIGHLNPGTGEFVAVMTSVENDFSREDWATPFEYKGVLLKSGKSSIGELSIAADAIILFTLSTW